MKSDYTEKDEFYFAHERKDVINEMKLFFQSDQFVGKSCLEIGCGSGTTGKILKAQFGFSKYIGVEYIEEAAHQAQQNIDDCFRGRVEDVLEKELKSEKFDCIIYLDVLEHLYDPWSVFNKALENLNPDGYVIASIPNIAFYEVVLRIIFDKFEYNPSGGIMDSTHIRWFTKHTIIQLFDKMQIQKISNNTVSFNKWYIKIIASLLKIVFKRFFTIQYLVIAKK